LAREVAVSAATRFGCRVAFVLLCASFATAFAVVINFENLPDTYFFSAGDQNIGSFYPGVTFDPDVTALSVSRFGGYDNSGFPPHAGDVVIWDATDPAITIGFASPTVSFGIWYTSFDPPTLQAFDASNNRSARSLATPTLMARRAQRLLLLASAVVALALVHRFRHVSFRAATDALPFSGRQAGSKHGAQDKNNDAVQ
jgi:hypothetical protein